MDERVYWKPKKRLAFDAARDALAFLCNRSDLTQDERIAIMRARHELFSAYIGQPEVCQTSMPTSKAPV
jgi:hypothetical protein